MKIEKDDKWKTVFCTRYGHFEDQVMLFNLSTIQTSFQEYINKIPAKKLDIFVIIYLENINIEDSN